MLVQRLSPTSRPPSSRHGRARRCVVLTLLASFLAAAAASAAATPRPAADVEAYFGVGAWIDVFDGAAWANPERAVRALAGRGVTTLYLQTATSRQGEAIHRPDRIARFLAEAHLRGMNVVAWDLPMLARVPAEHRRALRAIRFRTPAGDRFDGFALDIEAVAGTPRGSLRNRRVADLSARLRRSVGPAYALGAIIPAPAGLLRPGGSRVWPNFPYKTIARYYDVVLPMGYYTFHFDGAAAAYAYSRRNVEVLRAATADLDLPVHLIGGLAAASDRLETRAFVRAAVDTGLYGVSLYDAGTSGREDWEELQTFGFPDAAP